MYTGDLATPGGVSGGGGCVRGTERAGTDWRPILELWEEADLSVVERNRIQGFQKAIEG